MTATLSRALALGLRTPVAKATIFSRCFFRWTEACLQQAGPAPSAEAEGSHRKHVVLSIISSALAVDSALEAELDSDFDSELALAQELALVELALAPAHSPAASRACRQAQASASARARSRWWRSRQQARASRTERERRHHKYDGAPSSGARKKRRSAARPKSRLAAGAAERARKISRIAALQHDDDHQHEAHQHVQRCQHEQYRHPIEISATAISSASPHLAHQGIAIS